jgi:TrmH family RNA methyltransferase
VTEDLLSRVTVVLDHPKNVVNIAGVVRGMLNFGLSDLRLVDPDEFDAYRIEGIAHRSRYLVEATRTFDSLEDALADCTWIVGTTARGRTAGRNYLRPREVADAVVERAAEDGGRVALVFGREDKGLDNEALDLCQAAAIIPTNPEFSSLNLAQAFLVFAYEIFLRAPAEPEELPEGRRATGPPDRAELERMYGALEQGLSRIEFFKGTRPPESVMRALRTILARAEPDLRETRLLAAVGYEIGHYLDRVEAESDAGGA